MHPGPAIGVVVCTWYRVVVCTRSSSTYSAVLRINRRVICSKEGEICSLPRSKFFIRTRSALEVIRAKSHYRGLFPKLSHFHFNANPFREPTEEIETKNSLTSRRKYSISGYYCILPGKMWELKIDSRVYFLFFVVNRKKRIITTYFRTPTSRKLASFLIFFHLALVEAKQIVHFWPTDRQTLVFL